MPLEINISLEDKATPLIDQILETLSPEGLNEVNEIAAREGVTFLRAYHREFSASEGWSNKSLPTHGGGRKASRFGEDIAAAWQVAQATAQGFTLTNNAPGFAHKVEGGTITPKKAKSLTIPMIPEAHGVRVANYPGKLFRPKGQQYLMELDERGVGRVVYLLRKQVTHRAWEGALPSMDDLGDEILESINESILDVLE